MKTYIDSKSKNSIDVQKQRKKMKEAVKTDVSLKVSIAHMYRMGTDLIAQTASILTTRHTSSKTNKMSMVGETIEHTM